jgi:hypothetical protein
LNDNTNARKLSMRMAGGEIPTAGAAAAPDWTIIHLFSCGYILQVKSCSFALVQPIGDFSSRFYHRHYTHRHVQYSTPHIHKQKRTTREPQQVPHPVPITIISSVDKKKERGIHHYSLFPFLHSPLLPLPTLFAPLSLTLLLLVLPTSAVLQCP